MDREAEVPATQTRGLVEDLPFERLGDEARRLFIYLAAGGEKPPIEYLSAPGGIRDAWERVVEVVGLQCEREVECSWKGLAAKCVAAYHGAGENFEEMDQPPQLFWEAVARHLVNLITTGDPADLALLEGKYEVWGKWLVDRLGA